MAKLRVGFDVSPLYSGHKVRGIGFYTQRLLEEIKKLRNLEIIELKTGEEIKKANYDLLHIPYFHPYFFTLPFRKRRLLIVTIHDLIPVKYPKHYPPGVKGRLCWEIQKRLLKRADAIVTDSFASKKDIVSLTGYPESKIQVVYLAPGKEFRKLKTGNWRLEIEKRYRLPKKFILYVGDVNWNKNIPGLVKACERIRIPLVIVGKQAVNKNIDPTHPENKDLVWLQNYYQNQRPCLAGRQAETRNLFLLGFIPTKDLVAIYNLATVYCQPSFAEGFGLPVLEAMVCGCPVVSSNRTSLPEIADGAAVLVNPSVLGLVRGIKKAIEKRRELVSKGQKWVRKFSWQKTADKMSRLYSKLVKAGS